MANKLLIQLLPEEDFSSRLEVYQFLAETLAPAAQKEVLQAFYGREELGSIQIAEQVVLPHVESEYIRASKIFLIRLAAPICWSQDLPAIRLIVAIALKEGEDKPIKGEISQFVKQLADEQIIAQLLEGNFGSVL